MTENTGFRGAAQIRPALRADAALVHRLTLEAYEEYRGALVPESGVFRETEADVEEAILRGGAFIATVDGTPVGCARWVVERGGDGEHVNAGVNAGAAGEFLYIGRVSVLPSHRGRGIAAMLVARCEALARRLGLGEARLGVRIGLARNRELYERLGYVPFGEEVREGFGPIAIWMRRTF
jgi:GNAT superfamily N-acetyltransferase